MYIYMYVYIYTNIYIYIHLVVSYLRLSRQFFFSYERYFSYKPHKQNHLTNIQPNIYKKSHLNCPYKPLNNFLLNI